jgi:hypothetical protein
LTFGLPAPKDLKFFGFPFCLIMRLPDKGCSRNAPRAVN